MVNRTQLNSIANKVKKVLNNGIREGKSIEDIIYSGGVREILGYGSAFGFDDISQYDFDLGKFDGRITRADLDKAGIKHFGCTKIYTHKVTFNIEEDFEENKVTAWASVAINWCDKYGCWTDENITIKEWEIIQEK